MADECCNNCGQICITVTICGAPASGDITVLAEGTGTTASIPVTYTGKVTGLVVLNPGTGYTAATVTIAAPGGGGTTATATATVSGGHVTGLTITNPGSGYTAVNPAVTITGDGTSATGRATATSIGCAAITQAGKYLITTTSPDGFTFQQVITATCSTNNTTTSLARNGTIALPFNIGSCGALGTGSGGVPFPNGAITARNHTTGAVVATGTTDAAGDATIHVPTQANTPSVYDINIVDPAGRQHYITPLQVSVASCQTSSSTIPGEMAPITTQCLSSGACANPPLASVKLDGTGPGTVTLTWTALHGQWEGTATVGGHSWAYTFQASSQSLLIFDTTAGGTVFNGVTSAVTCPINPGLLVTWTLAAGAWPAFPGGGTFSLTE